MKTCTVCQQELPLSEFPYQKDTRKKRGGYYKSNCFMCHANKNLAHYHRTKVLKPKLSLRTRKARRRKYIRLYMRELRKAPYKKEYLLPLGSPSPSPSPEDWQTAAKESYSRILARRG